MTFEWSFVKTHTCVSQLVRVDKNSEKKQDPDRWIDERESSRLSSYLIVSIVFGIVELIGEKKILVTIRMLNIEQQR